MLQKYIVICYNDNIIMLQLCYKTLIAKVTKYYTAKFTNYCIEKVLQDIVCKIAKYYKNATLSLYMF